MKRGLLVNRIALAALFLVMICSTFILSAKAITSTSFANESLLKLNIPEKVSLDGRRYSRDQIRLAFLDAAFTKDSLVESLSLPSRSFNENDLYNPQYMEEMYPWLYPHLYPKDGLPRSLVVNKWTGPVRVSFGMPNDLKTFGPYSEDRQREFAYFRLNGVSKENAREFMETENFSSLEDHLVSLLAQVSDSIGINVSYIDHKNETKENYAEIRVNFVEQEHFYNNLYKQPVDFHSFSSDDTESFREIEGAIRTGFIFTKNAKKQVDGYFLTNSKNEIEMAFCYVWTGHKFSILKALVDECLIRAMGLPGAIQVRGFEDAPKSALTLWNEPESWPDKHKQQILFPEGISEFDQYLLRILYSPILMPGTDYLQAQRLIFSSE